MKIAVTGCHGRVGSRVVVFAIKEGHTVIGVDQLPAPDIVFASNPSFTYLQVDVKDYEETLKALQGCDAVAHLAGVPNPGDYGATTHNSNVVMSWNVLRAAAELGITRVAQASSVNVITMVFSKRTHFHYFPIDENHPTLPDEPYGLSKFICEAQADTIVRRYPNIRIASLRLHWSVPTAARAIRNDPDRAKNDLWGWSQEDSSAEAFLLAIGTPGQIDARWSGHERFFIAAPDIGLNGDIKPLREKYWPDVPIREGCDAELKGGFFDCGKAKRLLGWVHKDYSQV